MADDGYIKLHRRALDSWLWTLPAPQFKVAITAMLLANWRDGEMLTRGQRVRVPRGSFVTSLEKLAVHTVTESVRTIRTALDNLSRGGLTRNKSTNRFRTITIVNYGRYNDSVAPTDKRGDKPATSQRQATDNDRRKKERKKKTAAPPHPRHRDFVALWTSLYQERYSGASPTWGAKQGAWVKKLLTAHGYELCEQRARKLMTDPPKWLKGGLDLGTLVANFDRLAEGRPSEPQPPMERF